MPEGVTLLEAHFEELELSSEQRRPHRSRVNTMLKWAFEQLWLIPEDQIEKNTVIVYRFRQHDKHKRLDRKHIKHTEREVTPPLQLGIFPEDYVCEEKGKQQWTKKTFSLSYEKLPLLLHKVGLAYLWLELAQWQPKWYLANKQLDEEISKLSFFLSDKLKLRDVTIFANIGNILRLLGWLHRREENSIPLEELRLTTLVPFIPQNIKAKDCLNKNGGLDINQLATNKYLAEQLGEEEGTRAQELLDEYLNLTCQAPGAKVKQFNSVINAGKFGVA